MKVPTYRAWMLLAFGCIAMWLSFVAVLYFLTQPLTWLNGQPVLDVMALFEAALFAAIILLPCWLVLFPLTWNKDPAKAALFEIPFTWIIASAVFLLIDGRQFALHSRASEVLADGQDIIFMPFVIPAISVISGSIYACVVWASNHSANSIASE